MSKKKKKNKFNSFEKYKEENIDPLLLFNIEEIKSMREEINWRVKVAYNSSIAFITAFSFVVAQLFDSSNQFISSINENPDLFAKSAIGMLILISAWVGVQNANHLIEKRIELYTLDLMKIIYKRSSNVFFSWLGFMYGSVFFRKKFKNNIAKFFNASIGLFIYFLPNLIAFGIWIYLITFKSIFNYKALFFTASFFLFIAIGTSFFLFFYVIKVNKYYTKFYKNIMEPYFEKNKEI